MISDNFEYYIHYLLPDDFNMNMKVSFELFHNYINDIIKEFPVYQVFNSTNGNITISYYIDLFGHDNFKIGFIKVISDYCELPFE